LLADDVTGVGFADDIAIPPAVLYGLGALAVAGAMYLLAPSAKGGQKAAEETERAVRELMDQIGKATRLPEPQKKPDKEPKDPRPPVPLPGPDVPDDVNRRKNCQERTGFDICTDARTAEDVARNFASTQLERSVGEIACTQVGGEGSFDICGGGPGINLHCEVPGTYYVASLIGCSCCQEDGSIGYTWHPHQSPGDMGSERGRRRQDDNKRDRRERGKDRERKRRDSEHEDE
jgi:hypothetical protein